jgi:hypothetical protein
MPLVDLIVKAHLPVGFNPSLVSSVIVAEEREKIASESIPDSLFLLL